MRHEREMAGAFPASAQPASASPTADPLPALSRAVRKQKAGRLRRLLREASASQLCAPLQPDGQTLLHLAATIGSRRIVKLLLAHGADVNAADARGRTALHCARDPAVVRAAMRAVQRHRGLSVNLQLRDDRGKSVEEVVLRALRSIERRERSKRSRGRGASARPMVEADGEAEDDSSSSGSSKEAGAVGRGLRGHAPHPPDAFTAKLADEATTEGGDGDPFSWAGDMGSSFDAGDDWFSQVAAEAQQRRANERRAEALRAEAWAAQRGARRADTSTQAAAEERSRWQRAAQAEEAEMKWQQSAAAEQQAEAEGALGREAYEAGWQRLLALSGPILASDVPWPCALHKLCAQSVERVVLPAGVESSARRRMLQEEQRRWHPDKFSARFISRVPQADRDSVLSSVTRVSQCLNELLQEDKARAGGGGEAHSSGAG